MKKEFKKIKVGSVVEFPTRLGICYAQVINKHKKWGWVLALYEPCFRERLSSGVEVLEKVDKFPQFITFFSVQTAVNKGFMRITDRDIDVPSHLKAFPTFRSTNNFGRGDETIWFLFDGQKETRLNRPLSALEKTYSQRGIPSFPLIVERVENGYRPEADFV